MTLLGFALRLVPWLAHYPLHRDEALYGFWARLIASGRDPLLLTPWIDKPPLALYLLAGSLRAFGVSEWALRLPGMAASVLTVLAVYGLGCRAYGPRTALLAAALVAVSPFAILFAPTAFTDPWLTLWLALAAWAALAGRPFLAGLALGLAVASKQQGVLGIPLVIGLLTANSRWPMADGRRPMADGRWPMADHSSSRAVRYRLSAIRYLLSASLGFALIFGPVTYWDSLRWINRPSFWDRSLATYGGLYLAPLAQWPQRAADWARQLGYLYGTPALSAALLFLAAAVGGRGLRRTLNGRARAVSHAARGATADASRHVPGTCEVPGTSGATPGSSRPRAPTSGAADTIDWILATYIAAYLALHIVVTFQPWDRYLLPLVPLVSLLAARGIALAARRALKRPIATFFALVLALALTHAAWLGAAGRVPVGSDHGAYAGLDQVVATLRGQPADAIIYHRWLSWHYDFYLYDAPQERRWWGDVVKLVAEATRTADAEPNRPQWIVLPGWEPGAAAEIGPALAAHGLALTEMRRVYRPDGSRSFTMYRIVPSPTEPAP